jgi:hypothetical protein
MQDKSDGGKPVTVAFGALVVLALAVIVVMRHAFGVISVEVGTK